MIKRWKVSGKHRREYGKLEQAEESVRRRGSIRVYKRDPRKGTSKRELKAKAI